MSVDNSNINKIKLGKYSGFINQGDNAIAIGFDAGYTNQGANSIVIGANSSAINSDNSIVVGSNASSKLDISNQLVIGFDASNISFGGLYGTNLGKNNFRLGINTNNPQFTLDVSGEIHLMYIRDISGFNGSNGQVLSSTASGIFWKDDLSGSSGGGSSSSQWTISGNDIYNNNTGNIGIGTSITSSKLDVSGNVKIRGLLDMSNNVIREVSGIYFSDGSYIGHGSSFDINSNEIIKINQNTLVINTNGNIGIGKIDPSYNLDVLNNIRTDNLRTINILRDGNNNVYYFDNTIYALHYFNNKLYIGGSFTSYKYNGITTSVYNKPICYIDLNDNSLTIMSDGLDSINTNVCYQILDDGTNIYAVGALSLFLNYSLGNYGYIIWNGSYWENPLITDILSNIIIGKSLVYSVNTTNLYAISNSIVEKAIFYSSFHYINVTNLPGFDDGTCHAIVTNGNDIYAGGSFTQINGLSIIGIAKWNGSSWDTVGGSFVGFGICYTLAIDNAGKLYAGGIFTNVGDVIVRNIARWDPNTNTWSGLGFQNDGLNGACYTIAIYGTNIYVGGTFTEAGDNIQVNYIAKWDGLTWYSLGNGLDGACKTIAIDSEEINIYVGGEFTTADNMQANKIAVWNTLNSTWTSIGDGFNSLGDDCRSIVIDPDTNIIYAGGYFTTINNGITIANSVAKWDGSSWSNLGTGLEFNNYTHGICNSLNIYTDIYNNKTYLIIGGAFDLANGLPAKNIVKYNITSGSYEYYYNNLYLSSTNSFIDLDNTVFTISTYILFNNQFNLIEGDFTNLQRIGLIQNYYNKRFPEMIGNSTIGELYDIAVNYIGGTDYVYVGGNFTYIYDINLNGTLANNITVWDGNTWNTLGLSPDDGLDGPCYTIEHDDNSVIYVGGDFTTAGGFPANNIAKFSIFSSSWNSLGDGLDGSCNVIVYNNNNLFIGGSFSNADNISADNIVKYSLLDLTWSSLSNGLAGPCRAIALANNNKLYAGGDINYAGYADVSNIGIYNLNTNEWDYPIPIIFNPNTDLDINSNTYIISDISNVYNYNSTGILHTLNIIDNRLITIETWGAGGRPGNGGTSGGRGGYSKTTFIATVGNELKIVVGSSSGGGSGGASPFGGNGGGGGGASYVYYGNGTQYSLKSVAAGGGGGGGFYTINSNGIGGDAETNGANGNSFANPATGGGGASLLSNGIGGINRPDNNNGGSGTGPMNLTISTVTTSLANNGGNGTNSSASIFAGGGGGGSGFNGGGAGGYRRSQDPAQGAGGGGGSNYGDETKTNGTTVSSWPGGGVSQPNNNGYVRITTTLIIYKTLTVYKEAFKPNGGSWSSISDIRMKTDIELTNNQYLKNIINDFPLYIYNWNDYYINHFSTEIKDKQYGTIAQEILLLSNKYPELKQTISIVNKTINNIEYNDFHIINPSQFIYILTGALKELIKEQNEYTKQLEDISNKIDKLE